MEQYVLYLVLKNLVKKLNNEFKYSFNDMNSNGDNVAGVYVKGAEPSEYRALGDAHYFNIINRVQFLIQGSLDKNSLMGCLNLGSDIKKALINTYNVYITAPSEIGYDDSKNITIDSKKITSTIDVMITKIDMLSDLVSLGKSEQGKPRYSINFKVYYELRR